MGGSIVFSTKNRIMFPGSGQSATTTLSMNKKKKSCWVAVTPGTLLYLLLSRDSSVNRHNKKSMGKITQRTKPTPTSVSSRSSRDPNLTIVGESSSFLDTKYTKPIRADPTFAHASNQTLPKSADFSCFVIVGGSRSTVTCGVLLRN